MIINYAVNSSVGRVRKENQDNYFLNGEIKKKEVANDSAYGKSEEMLQVFAVCDGMGGEQGGETAAYIAVDTMAGFDRKTLWNKWKQYICKANQAICNFADENSIHSGTTFAGLFIQGNRFISVNVGDSRVYRIKSDGIEQLSKDHTEFQMLVDSGRLKKSDFAHTNTHNHLTQHLGIDPEELIIEPYTKAGNVKASDEYFLLCSDGLYGSMEDEQITEIVVDKKLSLLKRCDKLVEIALKQGSRDNVTAMLVHYEEINQDKDEYLVEDCEEEEPTQQVEGFKDVNDITDKIGLVSEKTENSSTANKNGRDSVKKEEKKDISENLSTSAKTEKVTASEPDKSGKRKWMLFGGLAGLVLLCLVGIMGRSIFNSGNPYVKNVVGLTAEEATHILEGDGFRVKCVESYDDHVVESFIIDQSVTEGERLRKNSLITLSVSIGPEPIPLPDVVNEEYDKAKEILEEYGWIVVVEKGYDDNVAKDHIINTIPSAGVPVIRGKGITLTVCKGPEHIEIPDLSSLSTQKASEKLKKLGLKVNKTVKEEYDNEIEEEKVIRTDPDVGEIVDRGEKVTMIVSKGPEPIPTETTVQSTYEEDDEPTGESSVSQSGWRMKN